MYSIYSKTGDKVVCLHDDRSTDKRVKVLNPKLKLGDSAAGSLEFKLPPTNIAYGKYTETKTTILGMENVGSPTTLDGDDFEQGSINNQGEQIESDKHLRSKNYLNVDHQNGVDSVRITVEDAVETTSITPINGTYVGKYQTKETMIRLGSALEQGYYDKNHAVVASTKHVTAMYRTWDGLYNGSGDRRRIFKVVVSGTAAAQSLQIQYIIYGMSWVYTEFPYYEMAASGNDKVYYLTGDTGDIQALAINLRIGGGSSNLSPSDIASVSVIDVTDSTDVIHNVVLDPNVNYNKMVNISNSGERTISNAANRFSVLINTGYYVDCDNLAFALRITGDALFKNGKTFQYKVLNNKDAEGTKRNGDSDPTGINAWNAVNSEWSNRFILEKGAKSFWLTMKYSDESDFESGDIETIQYSLNLSNCRNWVSSENYEDVSGYGTELVIKTEFDHNDITLDPTDFELGNVIEEYGAPKKEESNNHIRMLCYWNNFADVGCGGNFKLTLEKSEYANQNDICFKVINAGNANGTGPGGGHSAEGRVYNENRMFDHGSGAASFWVVVYYKDLEVPIDPTHISAISYKFEDVVEKTAQTQAPLYLGLSYGLYDENYYLIKEVDSRAVSGSIVHIDLEQKIQDSQGNEVIRVVKYLRPRYGYSIGSGKIEYNMPAISYDYFSSFSYGIQAAIQYSIVQFDNNNTIVDRTGPYRVDNICTFAEGVTKFRIIVQKANNDDISVSDFTSANVQGMKNSMTSTDYEVDLVERMRSTIIVKREISTPSVTTYDNFDPVQTTDISDRFEQGYYGYHGNEKSGTQYAVRTVSQIPVKIPAGGFVSVKCIGKLNDSDNMTFKEVDDTAANTYRFPMKYHIIGYSSLDLADVVFMSSDTESGQKVTIPNNVSNIAYINIVIKRYEGSSNIYTTLDNLSSVEVTVAGDTSERIETENIENGGYEVVYGPDDWIHPVSYEIPTPFAVRTPFDKLISGSFLPNTRIRVEAVGKSIDGTVEEQLDFGIAAFSDTDIELDGIFRGVLEQDSDGNVDIPSWAVDDNAISKVGIVLKRHDTDWNYTSSATDDHLHDSWKINQNQIVSVKMYVTPPDYTGSITNNDLDYSGNEMASEYTLCTGYLPLSYPAYTTSARIDIDTKQKYKMAWGIATYRLVDGQYEIIDMYRWLNTNDRFDKISGAPSAIRIFLKVATPDNEEALVETELDPTDILNFKITVQRVEYNLVEKEIWEGRVLSEDVDWQNNRVIYCEGELAYLNDTRMAPRIFNNIAFRNYIQAIIDNHNSKVAVERRFVLGETWEPTKKKNSGDYDRGSESEEDDLTHHTTNFETSLELLNNLVNDYGGHLRIRKSSGIRYIDWLADWPRKSNQVVQFGKNLLDYTRKYDLSNLFTVLYPTGKVLVAAKSSAVGDHVSTDPSVWKRYENTLLYLDDSDKTNQRVLMNSGPKLYGYLTVVATVEPGATYYFSSRLHGGLVAYCLYDGTNGTGNLHSQGIERAGSDTTPGFVDYVDKEITIPPGFHSIAMCCFGGAIPLALKTQTKEVEGIDKVVTIEEVASDVDVNGKVWHTKGSPYIMNPDLVEKYGWIERRIALEALEKPQEVYTAAKKYLSEGQYEDITLEVSAIDLNSLGVDADAIDILDEVRCVSEPHGLDRYFPVAEMEIPLNDPANQKFRMGSNPVQNLTTQHASSTNDLEQKAAAIPTKNSVISTAKASAAAMLNDTTTGSFITYGYDKDGKMSEMIISDTKPNEDGSYPQGTQLWRWNSRGLAHSSDGYTFDEENLNCAITAEGEIIANSIYGNYLYGTMVGGAKVVVGSGLPQTAAEVNRMLPAEKQPDDQSIISIRNAAPSGQTTPYIDMYDGTLYFGGVDGSNNRTPCGEIVGDFEVSQQGGGTHKGLLIQTPVDNPNGVIVINTPDLGVGTGGQIGNVQRTINIEMTLSTGSGSKKLKFINGMLVYAEDV